MFQSSLLLPWPTRGRRGQNNRRKKNFKKEIQWLCIDAILAASVSAELTNNMNIF